MLRELILVAMPGMGLEERIKVVGLPFNSTDVAARADLSQVYPDEYDVVYTSRFDQEKEPMTFLRLVENE